MRAGKGNVEEEEYEEDEFGSSKKQAPSSVPNTNKDAKAVDKASAIRSKHSVTEQRRRSKINERFQILRDLIPQCDQKRDTASFLLEVIEYVQYLQEKVQKYEGSYPGWSPEPSKLMPWVVILMAQRNSHWRVQNFAGQPQLVKNGSGPVSPFPGKLDESNTSISPTMPCGSQNMIDPDQSRDIASKITETQPDLASKGVPIPMAVHSNMPVPVRSDGVIAHPLNGIVSDAQSIEYPATSEPQTQQEELTVEGGTISISSVYSQGCVPLWRRKVKLEPSSSWLTGVRDWGFLHLGGASLFKRKMETYQDYKLLNNLTQALQSAGIDLSQASISVQINLGKRAKEGPSCGTSSPKNHDNTPSRNHANAHFRDAGSAEDSDQAQKRMKTTYK
ncbi:hypothetical protein Lal_00031165 [Lupinus albus]|nr:hypothetical protein Lal_00031165 [Lupinus albus]